MVDNEDISNLIPGLYLKQQLLYLSSNDIIEAYKKPEDYEVFLYTAANLIKNETAYFYLEEFLIEKIIDVTHHYRFENMKDSKLNNLINFIIIKSNDIKSNMNNIEYIKPLITNYVIYQEECRGINFKNDLELLDAIAKDYTVFYELLYQQSEKINDETFLISTNYFFNYCPEIYEISEIKIETEKKLKVLSNTKYARNYIMKEYTRSTEKIFQKIKKGE